MHFIKAVDVLFILLDESSTVEAYFSQNYVKQSCPSVEPHYRHACISI